jgi:hypothetical protein
VIGGRVLDASTIVSFASGSSVHAAALLWTAVAARYLYADMGGVGVEQLP